jgi:TIR domain-containing protein/SIR2-like protein
VSANDLFLPEADWVFLLQEIHNRQVIPIVGPELILVPNPEKEAEVPLYQVLAAQLATALNLSVSTDSPISLNRVACEYLLSGKERTPIYVTLCALLDEFNKITSVPPSALCDLASITDFNLYISSTIDSLLVKALKLREPCVITYDSKTPTDVPAKIDGTLVYHIVGSRETHPNFAVWEEDYLEFVLGLVRHDQQLKNLFLLLKTRYLLFLGAPFADWIVRFFLFLVKGGRFTDRRKDKIQAYLADRVEILGAPLIFFFDKVVGTTRIIPGDPAGFAHELSSRWKEKYATEQIDEDVLVQMSEKMPPGAVFVSYSRDDLQAVINLLRGLRAAQIPVWVDRQRLRAGENYERNIEFLVKDSCSFFVSVISKATESDPSRFVHIERSWAAQRHVDGFVFYIPVVIDDTERPKLEPALFAKIHFDRLPKGIVTPTFTNQLQKWVGEHRDSGQPRG